MDSEERGATWHVSMAGLHRVFTQLALEEISVKHDPKFGCASRAVSTSALETHTFPSSVLYHSLTGLLREHLPRIIVSLTIVAIKYPAM